MRTTIGRRTSNARYEVSRRSHMPGTELYFEVI